MHVTDEQVRLEVSLGNSVLLKAVCSRAATALRYNTVQCRDSERACILHGRPDPTFRLSSVNSFYSIAVISRPFCRIRLYFTSNDAFYKDN